LAELQAGSRTWTKAQYSELASRFGINPDNLPFRATPPDLDTPDDDTTDNDDADDASPEPMSDAQALAADADVARLDDLWKAFDIVAHRAAVRDLAMRANRPDPEPVVLAPVIAGAAPHAKRVGSALMHEVFGTSRLDPMSSLLLPIYDCATAPRIDPDYILPDCLPDILTTAIVDRTGVFLSGPAGTGKTTLAEQIAARLHRPFVRISCTANTDAATLVGMTVPEGDTVRFQPGILTRAIGRPGVVLLIDEPSTARDGIMYVLQSLLDDTRAIAVDETGDVFPLAPDAIVILADNTNGSGDQSGAYAGTRALSAALINRVDMFEMGYLPAHQEQAALVSRTGCTSRLAALLVAYANVTRAKVQTGEVQTAIGMRRLVSFARKLIRGVPLQDAAARAFLNAAPADAREVYQQLIVTHLPSAAIDAALKG
jgi:cobaltochelatase CobS